jgi:hypothetical protein
LNPAPISFTYVNKRGEVLLSNEVGHMQIKMMTQTLTDGSEVHDVVLRSDQNNVVILPATNYSDALALMEKIEAAITEHSLEPALYW